MAKLYFKIASDWKEVVRLRKEIDKLKLALKSINKGDSPAVFKVLNAQLAQTQKKMDGIVVEAAKTGAAIGGGLKKRIYDASQTVNGLSEKMTEQRGVIQRLKNELSELKMRYKEALKSDGDAEELGAKIQVLNVLLMQQKSILFDLSQQQANARLNVKQLREKYALYNEEAKTTTDTNQNLMESFGKILGIIGGAAAVKQLASDIVRVRGEFQQLEIAFETMLKSKEKADKLMAELVEISAKTPFDLQGIASSTKQMLAYGSSAETVGKELVMLGNIAAGVGAPLGDIAYLYGTLRTQGRAYSVDIKQFAGRGIPIYEELAKVLGVSKDKVNELVKAGKVGFPEVEKAFRNMTNSSGIYFNLMEEQSKSLTGQISNLGDAWDTMLNEIGKDTEGLASVTISGAKVLVENYEKVGKMIAGLAITYGTYRAAVIANITLTRSWAVAARADAAAKGLQTLATNALIVKQKVLNSVMKANPYVMLATAIVGVTTAIWAFADASDAAAEAQKQLNEAFGRAESSSLKEERRLAELAGKLKAAKEGTQEYSDAKEEIAKNYGKYYEGLDEEITKVGLTEAAYTRLAEAVRKSYMERGHASYLRDAEGAMDKTITEQLVKVQEKLYAELGTKEGSRVYTKLRDQLLRGNLGKGKGFATITGLDDDLAAALDKVGGGGIIKNRSVENALRDAIAAQEKFKKAKEKAKEIFKANAKDEEKKKTTPDSLYTEDLKKAEEEYKAKKKAFEEIMKSKEATTKEYNEAKENLEAAEKAFEALGGETDDKVSKKNKIAEKQEDAILKKQQKLNEEMLALKRKLKEDEAALEADEHEKKLKQADVDYEEEVQRLDKLREGWLKAQSGRLSQEQTDTLAVAEENAFKKYQKTVDDINREKEKKEREAIEKQQNAWNDYYIAYGDYQEKRLAITDKYNAEIAKVNEDSPEYATLMAQQKKELDRLDEELMEKSGLWSGLFKDMSSRSSSAIRSLIADIEQLIDHMNGVKGIEMPDIFKDDAKAVKTINDALSNPEATKKFTANLESSVAKFKKMLDKNNPFKQIAEGFKNKDSKSLAEGLSGIASAASQLGGIMESLGVSADSTAGKVTSAFSSTASMAAQGAAIGGPWGAAIGGALGLAGSLTKMFGADYSSYNRMVEEYNDLGEIWDSLIDKKREYINISYGAEALKAGEESLELLKKAQEAQRMLAAERAKAGKSAGSHSIAYRQNKSLGGYAAELYKYTSQKGNYDDITSALLGATAEELSAIRENMSYFWAKLDGDFKEHLENIIKGKEKADELANQMKESVTGISLEQFHDSYIDMLMDLQSTNKDFADDFGDMLQNAIMRKMFADQYREKIEEFYKEWAEAGKEGGGLTAAEVDALKKKQQDLVSQMIASREELKNDFGWTDKEQQEGSRRGFGAEMTHEDAGELSGRFTALQIAGEEIKSQSIAQTASLNILTMKTDALLSCSGGIKSIADDTRTLIAQSYAELQQISANTGAVVEPIRKMQKDIEQLKKNTSKL